MIPSPPDIPEFPKLNWSYENDKYCLSETDVDKLLDYGENELPLYMFEMGIFNTQIKIIMDKIINN